MSFTFIDLFAGIGGFHGALSALGGQAVYASEIDDNAATVYKDNWHLIPAGDITLAANETQMLVPSHQVLTGGFPCQPFSKSGKQKGMDETRGTLFWNIKQIIDKRQPKIVLLENVRNLAGPRHTHEWAVIIKTLRDLGYRVSSKPLVVSPHKIHPDLGGRPQVRERIFIAGTFVGRGTIEANSEPPEIDMSTAYANWQPSDWDLKKHLPLETLTAEQKRKHALNQQELRWIEAWNDFVTTIKSELPKENLPGFPIWVDSWVSPSDLRIPTGTPDWKVNFLAKNSEFYAAHKKTLDAWLKRWDNLSDFPPSRRKFEWQAQDSKTLWECIMHFRPSGIRAKKATYVPALVAITQTTIIGSQKRRLTVREAARLQGLPEWFDFGDQGDSASYKQLGNGVNIPAVYHVLKALVERDKPFFENEKNLFKSISKAPLKFENL
jgi:DNA (cytosine-5)-methyltransferase 1